MTFQMKCMAGQLANALNIASQVSGREKQLPILRCCRIAITKGMAEISATNLDHAVRTSIPAEGEGEVFLDIGMMLGKAAALRSNQMVEFKPDGATAVTVTQGRTRWKVPTVDGAPFPSKMFDPVKGKAVSVPRIAFLDALAMAQACVNPGITRAIDMGVYIDKDGKSIIGTDGKRMAVVTGEFFAHKAECVFPLAANNAVRALFKGADSLDVIADENAITFEGDDIFYKSKLVEMPYPDWRKVIDKNAGELPFTFTVDRIAFKESLTRATAIAEDKQDKGGTALGVKLSIANGECEFTTKNRAGEDGTDVCEAIGDAEGEISANAPFLNIIIDQFDSDRLKVQFKTMKDAIRISSEADDTTFCILMPYLV